MADKRKIGVTKTTTAMTNDADRSGPMTSRESDWSSAQCWPWWRSSLPLILPPTFARAWPPTTSTPRASSVQRHSSVSTMCFEAAASCASVWRKSSATSPPFGNRQRPGGRNRAGTSTAWPEPSTSSSCAGPDGCGKRSGLPAAEGPQSEGDRHGARHDGKDRASAVDGDLRQGRLAGRSELSAFFLEDLLVPRAQAS